MGAILCYHGLTSGDLASGNVANVRVTDFVATIRLLRRVGRIVPLLELLSQHQAGESTARRFAITFDDAYRSVYDLAADVLRGERVPVTVFPTLLGSQTGAPFWWDRLDDAFPRTAPARWRRFEDEIQLPAAYRTGQPSSLGPVRPVRQWILATWAGRTSALLDLALRRLEDDIGWRTQQRPMTYFELDEIASLPGVTIGVHTVTHPVLPLLSTAEQVAEIEGAVATLRARYPNFVAILAAPFGLFDAATTGVANKAGVRNVLTLAGRLPRPYRADGGVPRICLVQGLSRWQLLTRVFAPVGERGRRPPGAYPDLPSATT